MPVGQVVPWPSRCYPTICQDSHQVEHMSNPFYNQVNRQVYLEDHYHIQNNAHNSSSSLSKHLHVQTCTCLKRPELSKRELLKQACKQAWANKYVCCKSKLANIMIAVVYSSPQHSTFVMSLVKASKSAFTPHSGTGRME